jgi:hypothetical protein
MASVQKADRQGLWIQTYTGKQFWPLDARVEEVEIEDIAHSLAMLCRFNGHCRRFYSVAEHSVHVSRVVDAEVARWGLMHDAAEAYLSDLPQPIKRHMPIFRECEERLLRVIAERFALPWGVPEAIVRADMVLLATEKEALMGKEPAPWQDLPEALETGMILCHGPEQAKEMFLRRFSELFLDRA